MKITKGQLRRIIREEVNRFNRPRRSRRLSEAKFSQAELDKILFTRDPAKNLAGADLQGMNLQSAYLAGADLQGADLGRANMRFSNLSGANLSGANLSGANLAYANLTAANLSNANLQGARLVDSNLHKANLDGANLNGANLDGAKMPSCRHQRAGSKADCLEFEATFIWDDYFDTGEPYKETRTVFLDADDLNRYEDEGIEDTYDFAMRWAEDNLDGAMNISHVEISPMAPKSL